MPRRTITRRLIILVLLLMVFISQISWPMLSANADEVSYVGYVPTTLKNTRGTTISRYMDTTDETTFNNMGCTYGKAGQQGLVVLSFGYPESQGTTYGAHHYGDVFASTTAIAAATKKFMDGYWSCAPTWSNGDRPYLTLALGVTNHWGYTTDWYGHGQAWAQMVNDVASYVSGHGYYTLVAAGGADIELTWNDYASTSAWTHGYGSVATTLYFDYGACEGCPNPGGTWTIARVHEVCCEGLGWPVPEIYREDHTNADPQWVSIGAVFLGEMTQWGACRDSLKNQRWCNSPLPTPTYDPSQGLFNTPHGGWRQMWDYIHQSVLFSTDILWATPGPTPTPRP